MSDQILEAVQTSSPINVSVIDATDAIEATEVSAQFVPISKDRIDNGKLVGWVASAYYENTKMSERMAKNLYLLEHIIDNSLTLTFDLLKLVGEVAVSGAMRLYHSIKEATAPQPSNEFLSPLSSDTGENRGLQSSQSDFEKCSQPKSAESVSSYAESQETGGNLKPTTNMPENQNTAVSPIAQNMPSFLAASGMCAAFFMPWMTIMGLGLSGSTLGKIGDQGQMAWVILIMAAISAITHFVSPTKLLNVFTGVVPFVLLMYFVSKMGSDLFQVLGVGAWLTLGCGIVLIFSPVKKLNSPES